MAHHFFQTLPGATLVQDCYEEVFLLFTTENSNDTPWQHNRSVNQNSTSLEIELAFSATPSPMPSPAISHSNSRVSSPAPGALPGSPLGGGVASTTSESPYFMAGSSLSQGVSSLSPSLATTPSGLGIYDEMGNDGDDGATSDHSTEVSTTLASTPEPKKKLSKRKVAKNLQQQLHAQLQQQLLSSSTSSSPSTYTNNGNGAVSSSFSAGSTPLYHPQPQSSTIRKPFVIHQNLSTLSQPGQTGSVVWDSSVMMAKFLISIQGFDGSHPPSTFEREETMEAGGDDGDEGQARQQQQQQYQQQRPFSTMSLLDPNRTKIIELGSGCGLLGVVMSEFCKELLLTDQEAVLPLLVKNLKKNVDPTLLGDMEDTTTSTYTTGLSAGPTSSSKGRKKDKKQSHSKSTASQDHNSNNHQNLNTLLGRKIEVQELMWGQDLDRSIAKSSGFDYIVATDVIYNESILEPLVRTLTDLCTVRKKFLVDHGHDHHHQDSSGRNDDYLVYDDDDNNNNNNNSNNYTDNDSAGAAHGARGGKTTRTVVLIGQELRSDTVHWAFLEKMQEAGFRIVRIPKSLMDPDFASGYCIYACWLVAS